MASEQIDNIQDKLNWHWRNSMRTVRFLGFDARSALPIPLLLVYFRWSTVILTIITLLIFRHLERKGLTFPAALRNLRSWITGADRPALLRPFHRKFNDYG